MRDPVEHVVDQENICARYLPSDIIRLVTYE